MIIKMGQIVYNDDIIKKIEASEKLLKLSTALSFWIGDKNVDDLHITKEDMKILLNKDFESLGSCIRLVGTSKQVETLDTLISGMCDYMYDLLKDISDELEKPRDLIVSSKYSFSDIGNQITSIRNDLYGIYNKYSKYSKKCSDYDSILNIHKGYEISYVRTITCKTIKREVNRKMFGFIAAIRNLIVNVINSAEFDIE